MRELFNNDMPQESSAESLCSLLWPCPATETSQNSHSSWQHLITFAGRKWGNLSSQNCRKELGNVTLSFYSQETQRNAQILRTNWPQTAPWACGFLPRDYIISWSSGFSSFLVLFPFSAVFI